MIVGRRLRKEICRILAIAFVLGCITSGNAYCQAGGFVLITQEEAGLPPSKAAPGFRGVTRAPKITMVSPEGAFRSPGRFAVSFQAFGDARIDLNSLRVTYMRTPDVDLTARLRPVASAAGIEIPAAIVPIGEHWLRIAIRDTEGRVADRVLAIKVGQ